MNRYHILLIFSISVVILSASLYFYSELSFKKSVVADISLDKTEENMFVEQTTPGISITKINKLENKRFSWIRTELTGLVNIISKSPSSFIISFNEDFKFSTSADCNINSGDYQISENSISFSEIVATRVFCKNSQENIYVEQLTNVEKYEIDGDNLYLILSDKKGRMVFISKEL